MMNSASDQNEDIALEVIPPELLPIHQRLEKDGGAWRASLPPPDELLRRVAPSSTSGPVAAGGLTSPFPPAAPTDFSVAQDPGYASSVAPVKGILSVTQNRMRGIAAGVAVVAIIALFALLLRGFSTGKDISNLAAASQTATLGTALNTPVPNVRGRWRAMDSMNYTSRVFTQKPYPVFAPSNPSIVYETTLSPVTVRRSDDGGVSWQPLDLPPGADQAIEIEIFASPLDASTAFLTVTVNLAYGQGPDKCPSTARAALSGATHGAILASGQVPCSTTYRTTDEGGTWHKISFPVNGTISTPLSDSAPYAGKPLQAQGQRLYALINCGPTCVGPGARLVSSADGGATWRVADGGGLGSGVCDFATAPDSQTIFAAISNGSCDVMNSSALSLYRSGDGGASWVDVGSLFSDSAQQTNGASQGMAVAQVDGKSMLYLNLPAVNWQPHIIGVDQSPAEYRVSADGGHTWKSAPSQGLPNNAKPVIAPLIVRADGSLVVAFSGDAPGSTKLYTWKPGEASWKVFAPAPDGLLSTVLRTVSTTGDETYWAVLESPNALTTFSVLSYQP